MNIIQKEPNIFFKWWTKLSISSFFQLVTLCLIIAFSVKTAQTFQEFGWGINDINSPITLDAQNSRLWLMLSCSLFVLFTSYNLYIIVKTWKYIPLFRYTFALFGFLFIPILIKNGISNNFFKQFLLFLSIEKISAPQISHKISWSTIRRRCGLNKLCKNTWLLYFNILIFIVALGLLFYQDPSASPGAEAIYSYKVFAYFTKLSNICCAIFLFIFCFFNKKLIFRNNTLLNATSTYIFVVGIIYWLALFPVLAKSGKFDTFSIELLSVIWLHAVTPTSFISFAIYTYYQSKERPTRTSIASISTLLVYPTWYGLYAYSLPFMIKQSVYGIFTNLNPYMINYRGIAEGSPWFILTIPLFGILFVTVFLIFNLINNKVVNKIYR